MNPFALLGIPVATACAIAIAAAGLKYFGWLGAFAGAIAGWFLGGALVFVAIPAYLRLVTLPERLAWRRALQPHFGRYWSRERAPAWAALKSRMTTGSEVAGVACVSMSHGTFVDIGCGFPARLGVHWSRGGWNGPQPAPGDELRATVRDYDRFERIVELEQPRATPANAAHG